MSHNGCNLANLSGSFSGLVDLRRDLSRDLWRNALRLAQRLHGNEV